ncbi:MAG: 2-oxoacid:acceptor oxidoreductase family protein, partial [Oscillospiraceae bacterium]
KVFVDSSIADAEILRDDVEIYRIPASQLAEDKGLAGMGNIIILGKIINECYSILGGIDADIFKDALHEIIPLSKAELIEKNISALQIGKST